MRAAAPVRDADVLEPVPPHPVPVVPYYAPWSAGGVGYTVVVLGRPVMELWRGKSSWWMVTDRTCRCAARLRDAEAIVRRACDRLGEVL